MKLLLKEFIYFGSVLVFPFLALLVIYRKKLPKLLLVLLLVGCLFFIWARFVERQMIIVREHTIDTGFSGRVVLISDTHLGVYKKSGFLERVVQVINEQNPQYVMIAGDFTYEPEKGELSKLFDSFSDVKVPVYAVLGNHDVERPGPPVRDELKEVLEKEGVIFLNNQEVILPEFTLLALGDNWSHEDDVQLINKFKETDNIVVLTHNPDTTLSYTNINADVTLTGHTHCGQIRIPWLYKKVIPTEGPFDKGFTQEKYTKLYITCGLGEVGLPMRLFNPPVIDVLNFK
jgi:predicted MPP superfamily phosphohydrolase